MTRQWEEGMDTYGFGLLSAPLWWVNLILRASSRLQVADNHQLDIPVAESLRAATVLRLELQQLRDLLGVCIGRRVFRGCLQRQRGLGAEELVPVSVRGYVLLAIDNLGRSASRVG